MGSTTTNSMMNMLTNFSSIIPRPAHGIPNVYTQLHVHSGFILRSSRCTFPVMFHEVAVHACFARSLVL